MAKTDQVLVLDIGSTGVRVCEFDFPAGGGFILLGYMQVEYTEQLTEENRSLIISAALRSALEEGGFTTTRTFVCVSGQAAFMRFVKLPPVTEEESRVRQIVEYEARQNVPFPMDEVIWDYQLIGGEDDELEVMFVVIKNDIVEGVIEAVNNVGLKPDLVDFAPAALYNVARANHVGDDECVMILNIGGRCTNLLFLDGDRFFARTIPIAGYSITQQIAKEFAISPEEAEILKRRHGFVALGGAYEEPESEVAATISKIVRNVMTRLHGEVNRSISVYRTQQKGNKPAHLYLSGGSSTMAFTDHFFSEKLRMDVSYLNPFKIIKLGPDLSVDDLQQYAHAYPEAVGVGLRHLIQCPVEVSLIPDSIKQLQLFSKRKPFILMAMVIWLLILGVFWVVNAKKIVLYRDTMDATQVRVEKLKDHKRAINRHQNEALQAQQKAEELRKLISDRYAWSELYRDLQLVKPNDMWFVKIEHIDKPQYIKPDEEEIIEEKKPKRGGFFMAPQLIGQAEAVAEEIVEEEAVWFVISGHSVNIPDRKIYSDEQMAQFDAITEGVRAQIREEAGLDTEDAAPEDAVADPDEAAAEEPEELAATVVEIEEFGPPPNRVTQSTQLPELLVSAIRDLPAFSDDPEETRMLELETRERLGFRNLSSFRIQVKLITPISLSH
ncbi:MAG: type IV pilus assembly protein PilM [Lentisphaeria bacterium]|nr:type IV pilus assembly protein PilM [Lentisphaeria bacterium]